MSIEELKQNILNYKIPERWYSLDDGLKPDAYILYKNYSKVEFFYLDEKGDRCDFKIFLNENEAYEYLWNKLIKQYEVFQKYKR